MRHNNRRSLFPIPNKLVANRTLEKLEEIALTANKSLISPDIYKGKCVLGGKEIQDVRDLLKEIFHNKCAYCENKEHKPEVEHYRPKKEVKEAPNHLGYYWLCYEWTNLLPACHSCNTELGKRTKFPIQGLRVKFPMIRYNALDTTANDAKNSLLIDERPYLLHPEIDHPETGEYFKFYNNKQMEDLDVDNRGQ